VTGKLEPHTEATLHRLAARHPALRLPFLVTLTPGAKATELRPRLPFIPSLEVGPIRLVAGEMTARQALDLATRQEVERIEYDGKAQALEQLAVGIEGPAS
jgi:hypothetical protein